MPCWLWWSSSRRWGPRGRRRWPWGSDECIRCASGRQWPRGGLVLRGDSGTRARGSRPAICKQRQEQLAAPTYMMYVLCISMVAGWGPSGQPTPLLRKGKQIGVSSCSTWRKRHEAPCVHLPLLRNSKQIAELGCSSMLRGGPAAGARARGPAEETDAGGGGAAGCASCGRAAPQRLHSVRNA